MCRAYCSRWSDRHPCRARGCREGGLDVGPAAAPAALARRARGGARDAARLPRGHTAPCTQDAGGAAAPRRQPVHRVRTHAANQAARGIGRLGCGAREAARPIRAPCRARAARDALRRARLPVPAARGTIGTAAQLHSAANRLASTLRRRRHRLLHMASGRCLPETSKAKVGLMGLPLRLLCEMWAVALTLAALAGRSARPQPARRGHEASGHSPFAVVCLYSFDPLFSWSGLFRLFRLLRS